MKVKACWSATLQAPATQHAIWLKKLWFEGTSYPGSCSQRFESQM
jgi:hypothetical protein